MFCKNCGNQIADSVKFCDECGASQEMAQGYQAEFIQPKPQKRQGKGAKIGGIVMTALGGLSVLGSFANDYYWNIAHNGVNISDLVTIGIQIALIAVGVYLIYKSKK